MGLLEPHLNAAQTPSNGLEPLQIYNITSLQCLSKMMLPSQVREFLQSLAKPEASTSMAERISPSAIAQAGLPGGDY